jgi:tripartite-type tricarboxylate transporter receptor subunit TctC
VGLASVGVYSKLPFDPVRDLAAISLISLGTNVLVVHPSLPANSVQDLIALAKAQPGKLNYANAGAGSPMHLAGVLFNHLAATRIVDVPYKGGGPALAAMLSHEIDLMFGALVATMPAVKSGKLRAIAVTTAKRSAVLPNVPTVAESGLPGYEFSAWTGLFAPRATPAQMIHTLNAEVVRIMNRTEVRKSLAEAGPASSTPGELQAILAKEVEQWRRLLGSVASANAGKP